MTLEEFETAFDNGDLDNEYAEYLYNNCTIGNGDMLINAMERGDLYEDFMDSMVGK
jgi:hypothetical protein